MIQEQKKAKRQLKLKASKKEKKSTKKRQIKKEDPVEKVQQKQIHNGSAPPSLTSGTDSELTSINESDEQNQLVKLTPKKQASFHETLQIKTDKKTVEKNCQPLKQLKKKVFLRKNEQNDEINQAQHQEQYRKRDESQFIKVSFCEKLVIAIIGVILHSLLLSEPSYSGSLMHIINEQYEDKFEIVSLKATQRFQFSIQKSQPISDYLPIESMKAANIQVSAHVRMGYDIENINIQQEDGNEGISIKFSDLKILSYDIQSYHFLMKEDGFFNKWQIQEINEIQEYAKEKYIPQLQKRMLEDMDAQQKMRKIKGAQKIVNRLISSHESWFNQQIQRLNRLADEVIKAIVPRLVSDEQEQAEEYEQNDVISFIPSETESAPKNQTGQKKKSKKKKKKQ